MGKLSQEQINVNLFDEVKRLKLEKNVVQAEKETIQAKWEAQVLMIQKLHEENKAMKKYISNGIELGYIDDREGDYKKNI